MGDSRMITKIHRLTLRQFYATTIIKLTKMCNDENKTKCEHGQSHVETLFERLVIHIVADGTTTLENDDSL